MQTVTYCNFENRWNNPCPQLVMGSSGADVILDVGRVCRKKSAVVKSSDRTKQWDAVQTAGALGKICFHVLHTRGFSLSLYSSVF
jgi:hypothetical protein